MLACIVAATILGLLVLLLFAPDRAEGARTDVVRLALLFLAVAVVISCGRTARLARGYNKRVWNRLTATGVLWTVGQCLWYYNQQVGSDRAPALHVMLLALVPAVWALALIPPEERSRAERLRIWLGAAIVVASVVLFCRSLVLAIDKPADAGRDLAGLLSLVHPLAHVVMACVVWIVLLRVGAKGRAPLFFVTGALIVYAWANVYFCYHGNTSLWYSAQVLDAATAWCYLLFILAALSPNAADPRQPAAKAAKGRYIGLQSLVVYVPVVTAVICESALGRTSNPVNAVDRVVTVSGILVLVLFGVRLMLLSIDNSRLRDDLQGRVDALVESTSAVRRAKLQNDRIMQSVVDGVIGVDADGKISFANPAAADMLGHERNQLLNQEQRVIFARDNGQADSVATTLDVVATAMTTGLASLSESQFVTSGGRVFPVELAVGPILEDEHITGAVVVFRDVSERRKVEKMKNEFVSVVSHELRTPLTSIRGSLGLLAGGAAGLMSPKADRMVSVALESSERLTRLINDMLDIERIESGTMPVQLTECNARELMDKAVDAVRGISGDHAVVVHSDPDLPRVRADGDRIVQTLTNLIGNAIKFSAPSTRIDISARSAGDLVTFTVSDQGRGIPADKLGRIFERFEQVDSSDSRDMGGTGLGLAISRTIIDRHGGRLEVTSQVGVGPVFRFSLPAVVSPAAEAGAFVGVPRILPNVKTSRLAN